MRVSVLCLMMVFFITSNSILAELEVDAISKSIIRVRAYENNKVTMEGAGFVVNEEGKVLTNAHLVKGADRITVVSLKTGAEILAEREFADRDANLALLQVKGLGLPPLDLSEQGAEVGRIVQTLKFGAGNEAQLSQGTIGVYYDIPDERPDAVEVRLLQHNAMITSAEFGMPLFNECSQVVAINLPDPNTGRWPFRRVKEPEGTVSALRIGDIIARLSEWDIPHTVVEEACQSAVERAEQSAREKEELAEAAEADKQAAEEARQQAEAEKQAAEEARRQAEAEKQAAEEARQQAEADKQAAEEARQQAETDKQAAETNLRQKQEEAEAAAAARLAAEEAARLKEAEAEKARQQQKESSQMLKWGAIIGSALLLLALLGWYVSSRRKKRVLQDSAARLDEAEQEAEAARQSAAGAPQPAPFKCLLEGTDDAGRQFVLNIPALALGDPAGVIIGRNPANAEFIIDHEAISREHIRLTCSGGLLHVEDLGTTNGTRVNGRLLDSRESSTLQDHDQLELGPVRFTVRLL